MKWCMLMRVEFRDLGRVPYADCWEMQLRLFDLLLERKRDSQRERSGYILFVEHPPVYTLGKSGKRENMLISEEYLKKLGAEFYHIDRGGDITFHGEGQIVGYPILDLEGCGIGLRDYIYSLEEAIIRTIAHYGLTGERIEGASGVWLKQPGCPPRKICAIGVRSSRFITMHGFAFNVSTDLKWFQYINPCGFSDRGVTSLEREVGHPVDMDEVKLLLLSNLEKILKIEIYKK